MREVTKARRDPARPKSLLSGTFATATAITREFANYTLPLVPRSKKDGEKKGWNDKVLEYFPRLSHLPPMGHMWLMAANLSLVLAITLIGFDLKSKRIYESIGTRAGWMTLTQLPLVFLMAGKANIVGRITGTSYERLNWIHRSVSRCMFITSIIHMAYFMRSWAQYDYINIMLGSDIHSRRGLGAFCVLSWMMVSSLAPIRGWRYEVFVIQHMISAIGFLVIVWMHVPATAHIYVWFPVGLWAFDRLIRWVFMLYRNFSIFHPSSKELSAPRSVFACKAVFRRLDDNTTRITIRNPPMSWNPGQHAFLTCHSVALFQQHPFTITSLPSDGSLEFVISAHGGGTKKMHRHACECGLPAVNQAEETKTVVLDGPYGRLRPLEQFDTVVLISGSTGASFCAPLLRDLVYRKKTGLPLVTRKVRFVWVLKKGRQAEWFSAALAGTLREVEECPGLEVEVSIYVTCDSELTAEIGERSGVASGASSSASSTIENEKRGLILTAVGMEEKKGLIPTVVGVEEDCGSEEKVCCCHNAVDEDDIAEDGGPCCCCSAAPQKPSEDRRLVVHRTLQLPESVKVISGRPMVKKLVEKELEKARGESAVVVCGPNGLVQATRAAVVQLSDERAVHKGTGAQGVCCSCSLWVGMVLLTLLRRFSFIQRHSRGEFW